MKIYRNAYKSPSGILLTYASFFLTEEEAREKGTDKFLGIKDDAEQYDTYQFTFSEEIKKIERIEV